MCDHVFLSYPCDGEIVERGVNVATQGGLEVPARQAARAADVAVGLGV